MESYDDRVCGGIHGTGGVSRRLYPSLPTILSSFVVDMGLQTREGVRL